MAKFASPQTAYDVFASLFQILLSDETFVSKARDSELSLHLIVTKPDLELFVSPDTGVVAGPPPRPAATRIKMSCDTAHELIELLLCQWWASGVERERGGGHYLDEIAVL